MPLHSGETSRTRTWSRASDSQPPQSPDISRTPPATRHVSASTPNISSAGSSPNLSPDTSNKLYLEALECIPLLPYDVPLDWTTAYPFLLTVDLANLRKYQISTFDYVPQPAHKLLRTCFESVLYAIDKLPDVNVPNDSPTQAAYIRIDYIWRFLLCFSSMTAIWASTHDKMSLRGAVKIFWLDNGVHCMIRQ